MRSAINYSVTCGNILGNIVASLICSMSELNFYQEELTDFIYMYIGVAVKRCKCSFCNV